MHRASKLVPATRFYVEEPNEVPVALSGGGGPQTGWETTMLLFVHIIVVSALVVGGGFGAVSMLWLDSNEVPASNPETPRTPAPSPRSHPGARTCLCSDHCSSQPSHDPISA